VTQRSAKVAQCFKFLHSMFDDNIRSDPLELRSETSVGCFGFHGNILQSLMGSYTLGVGFQTVQNSDLE